MKIIDNAKASWNSASILKQIGIVFLGVVLVIWIGRSVWNEYSRTKHAEAMAAEKEKTAAAEARAEMHRQRQVELEKENAANVEARKAKDVLIEANVRDREAVNDAIDAETARFEAENRDSDNLPSDELRKRICAKLAAKLPEYCSD